MWKCSVGGVYFLKACVCIWKTQSTPDPAIYNSHHLAWVRHKGESHCKTIKQLLAQVSITLQYPWAGGDPWGGRWSLGWGMIPGVGGDPRSPGWTVRSAVQNAAITWMGQLEHSLIQSFPNCRWECIPISLMEWRAPSNLHLVFREKN